jgi:uncharacterized membrane protein
MGRYHATGFSHAMPLPTPPTPRSAPDASAAPAEGDRAVATTRALAVGSLIALIVLGLAWEMWLAPLRPGGSLLALKVLPLVLPLAGQLKRRMYTYRWVSLMIWLYFTEGVVRAWSDTNPVGRALAGVEIVLCLLLFVACAWHVRTRLARADALRAAESAA